MPSVLRSTLFAFALTTLTVGCGQGATTAATTPPTSAGVQAPNPTQTTAAVSLPACGQVAIPSTTAAPDALNTPAASADTVTVTSADDGATVFLTTRQHLVVEVGFPGSPRWSGTPQGADVFWDVPQAPSPGPLYREGSATCPGGRALAVFTAVGTGGTTVSTTTDAPCLHTQPACAIGQKGVEIYVVVRRSQ